VYKVTGRDNEGYFTGNRRYNEFYLLRQVLALNFPGIFVPPVPGKKFVGNKDFKFILERRYYLGKILMSNRCRTFFSEVVSLSTSNQQQGISGVRATED
jgi:sorting nexin-1/2